jgi:hypothetical protein
VTFAILSEPLEVAIYLLLFLHFYHLFDYGTAMTHSKMSYLPYDRVLMTEKTANLTTSEPLYPP